MDQFHLIFTDTGFISFDLGMHCIREFFIVIDAPFLLLEAFYECCVAVIHNITPFGATQRAMKIPDKFFIGSNDMEFYNIPITQKIVQYTFKYN